MRKDLKNKEFKFWKVVVHVQEFDKGVEMDGTGFKDWDGVDFVGGEGETVVHFENVHDFFHDVLLFMEGHEVGA